MLCTRPCSEQWGFKRGKNAVKTPILVALTFQWGIHINTWTTAEGEMCWKRNRKPDREKLTGKRVSAGESVVRKALPRMHLNRDLNAEEATARRGGFQVKKTAAAKAWIQDCPWQAQRQGEGQSGLHVVMEAGRGRWSRCWDVDSRAHGPNHYALQPCTQKR